jgi:hypothetical protein
MMGHFKIDDASAKRTDGRTAGLPQCTLDRRSAARQKVRYPTKIVLSLAIMLYRTKSCRP